MILLAVAVIASLRRQPDDSFFPVSTTTELKGVAILLVVLAHIGYFLVNDNRFLTPLSNFAGVGVDLLLLLSGYGLAASALRRPLSPWAFYRKRLLRVYLPVVGTVFLLLLLDRFFLGRVYPLMLTLKNLLGLYPQADLYRDIDSPLWFITPLLVYYLFFPIVFWRRVPLLSSVAMGAVSWLMVYHFAQPVLGVGLDVVMLYQLHYLAFPIGMALGAAINQPARPLKILADAINRAGKNAVACRLARYAALAASLAVLGYLVTHSAVGNRWQDEEAISIATAAALIGVFVFKRIRSAFLCAWGALSLEVYLLHWPLLYRYHLFIGGLPAAAGLVLALAVLLGIAYIYQKTLAKIKF